MFTSQKNTLLLSSVGLLLLVGGQAMASPPGEGAKAEPPPVIQLVGLIPDTGQAILWDEGRHGYLVVKSGDDVRGARVDKVSADGVLISQGKISLVVPLAPSPFLLRRHVDLQGEAGPPAVIIAPRQYQKAPPFLGDKPAAPAMGKQAPPADKPSPASKPSSAGKAQPAAPRTAPETADKAPAATEFSLSLGQLRVEVSNCLGSRAAYKVSLTPSQGILFQGIAEGSLPHRMGLRSGDTLVSLGGQVLRDRDAAADAYLNLVPGAEVDLVVLRESGQRQTLKVVVGV